MAARALPAILAVTTLATAVFACAPAAYAQDNVQGEIRQIKTQLQEMDQLKARLAALETKLNASQKEQEEIKKKQDASSPSVIDAFKGAKIKIDGRAFAGVFSGQSNTGYSRWGTDMPDAKLRFIFNPSKNVTFVSRLSMSRASINTSTPNKAFDYFYLDYKGALSPTNTIRIGQRKVDFGQETWTDNPIENILISNSAPHIAGYAPGVALLGTFDQAPNSPLYELGVETGSQGVMPASKTASTQWNAKVGVPFASKFFASASYFDSGTQGPGDQSALTVGEIGSAPTGATSWSRKIYELDLRYNYGPTGWHPIIPSNNLPPFMVGAAIGEFKDSATGAADRNGKYWLVEGLYNVTPVVYVAGRYSRIGLDNGYLDKLDTSPVAVNAYARTSLGIGYRLTSLTELKMEYSFNSTSGGASQPKLDQWGLGVSTKF